MARRGTLLAISGLSFILLGWQYQTGVVPRRAEAQRLDRVDSLAEAVDHGDVDTVATLLNEGTGIEPSTDGLHPLHLAAWRGDTAIMEMLLARQPDLEVQDRLGKTPLMRSLERSRTEVARLLLEKGARIEARDRLGYTPLMLAARAGHLEGVRLLLRRGANVHVHRPDGLTPLLATAKIPRPQLPFRLQDGEARRVEVAKLLLAHGADFRARTRSGMSLVSMTVDNNYPELLQFAIARGASIRTPIGDGTTPVVSAVWRGNVECLEILLEHGAPLDARSPSGETLLSLALDGYSSSMSRFRPAWVPRAPRGRRRNLFDDAEVRSRQYRSVIGLLLSRGVSVGDRVRSGGYPLSLAASAGDVPLCEELLRRGNPVNGRDRNGQTPLMSAATFARVETVRFLLQHGADPTARDIHGDTAYALLARPREYELPVYPAKHEVVKALLQSAAAPSPPRPKTQALLTPAVKVTGRPLTP
jgi:ankyrin repeat protein